MSSLRSTHESHLSVRVSEVGVVAGAFHVVRRLGLVGDQTQEAATSFHSGQRQRR